MEEFNTVSGGAHALSGAWDQFEREVEGAREESISALDEAIKDLEFVKKFSKEANHVFLQEKGEAPLTTKEISKRIRTLKKRKASLKSKRTSRSHQRTLKAVRRAHQELESVSKFEVTVGNNSRSYSGERGKLERSRDAREQLKSRISSLDAAQGRVATIVHKSSQILKNSPQAVEDRDRRVGSLVKKFRTSAFDAGFGESVDYKGLKKASKNLKRLAPQYDSVVKEITEDLDKIVEGINTHLGTVRSQAVANEDNIDEEIDRLVEETSDQAVEDLNVALKETEKFRDIEQADLDQLTTLRSALKTGNKSERLQALVIYKGKLGEKELDLQEKIENVDAQLSKLEKGQKGYKSLKQEKDNLEANLKALDTTQKTLDELVIAASQGSKRQVLKHVDHWISEKTTRVKQFQGMVDAYPGAMEKSESQKKRANDLEQLLNWSKEEPTEAPEGQAEKMQWLRQLEEKQDLVLEQMVYLHEKNVLKAA